MLFRSEETRQLLEVLKHERPDYREIIELRYLEKLSYKEIALRLKMSETGVGEKLFRVRQRILRKMNRKPDSPRS